MAEVVRWTDGIEKVHEYIAWRFRHPEPRRQALEYLKGLLSPLERENSWQTSKQADNAAPNGVQLLLYNYRWGEDPDASP